MLVNCAFRGKSNIFCIGVKEYWCWGGVIFFRGMRETGELFRVIFCSGLIEKRRIFWKNEGDSG